MIFKGRQLNTRIAIVVFVFCFLWAVLFLRSGYLQLLPNEKLSGLQNKLFERTVTLKPRRGVIYDRYGKELVISTPSQSLFADPQRMKKPYYAAKKLSQFLNISRNKTLKRLLNKNRRFVWIKRHLSPQELETIKSWKLDGLYFIKESKRFYTKNNSLSQVLGFTGIEGQGLEGIEKQYDEILKGQSQKVLLKRDARGRPLFMDFSPFITKVSGFDIYLTIDSDLQFYLEKELQEAIQRSKAESAIGIVLSAKTSEVLAMANIPNYNPNISKERLSSYTRNRALTDVFEPGSTLKTFTLVSALKKGISPTQAYSTGGGELKIGESVIEEADPKKKFKDFLNMSEILAFSSNVGVAEMALDVGPKRLRKTLSLFGFGEKTGIDFPGEAKGLLRELPWRPVETATVSFGHGVAGTALQVANAYAAIANGGLLKKPFLVKQIKNPYTGEEKIFKSQNFRRVLKPEEARILTLMLISVTEEYGTGFQAVVPGYFVAGKTGTAQKVDLENKGYKKGEYITSFAGFIPAHNPKFVIYLVIDGAKDNFYASSLVAPLFSQVASYSVRSAGLSPTLLEEDDMLSNQQKISRQIAGAGVDQDKKDQKISESKTDQNELKKQPAADNIEQDKFHRKIAENKTNQNEEIQEMINEGRSNWKTPELLKNKKPVVFALNRVPDLKGLSLREALNQMQASGLTFKIHGSGRLVRSIPTAGDHLPESRKITLIFD